MISLNDVLLARANIPVDDPIAEIWGRQLQGGYKIIEYTGSLPITITANGNALLDYRIYGTDGGVGVATENLFDENSPSVDGYITDDGTISTASAMPIHTYDYIAVSGSSVSYKAFSKGIYWYTTIRVAFYDVSKNFISRFVIQDDAMRGRTVQLPNGCAFIRLSIDKNLRDIVIIEGSTAPTSYIPYGYKLPMTVMDNLAPPLSQWIDGYITVIGSIVTAPIILGEKVSDFIEVKPNTRYVFSIEGGAFPKGTDGAWVGIGMYRDDRTFITRYTHFNTSPCTFLTQEGTKYVRLSYRSYGELWEPRLSESSFSTSVYIGENQLDAIGEYRDYVDFGIQKIARKIREYTFTGNETFNLFAQNAYGTCWVNLRLYTTVAYCPIHQTTLRSSHFTAINNSDANFWYGYPQLDDVCNFEKEDGYDTVKIFFRSTANFSTAEECKAYFKEQYDNGTPVKIWFVMKYTVGQYESTDNGKEDPPVPLPEIPTIDGTTVIDYDGDPKPSRMYVKYKGKSGGA